MITRSSVTRSTATPAAGCWQAEEIPWSFIAGSNAGATVTWTVDALDRSTTPPTVRRAASVEIGFSRRDVKGAIFYWSTTNKGIRRANIADAVPEDYIVGGTSYEDGDQVKCVACHAVSRDGKYMAAPTDSTSGKSLWITEVSATPPPPPLVKDIADTSGHMFASISPDNQFVAVTHKDGRLWLVDRVTGDYLEDVPVANRATQPDWSPDGKHLVYATRAGDAPKDAAIARISFDGLGNWGSEEILVQRDPQQTDLWPMYAPDGEYIAFSRGSGGHGDKRAQLHLVSANGGEPIELVSANRAVSNRVTDGQHQNSLPTWAPSGDLYWVAFNSMREYGVVLDGGRQQIWVAAIDPAKIGTGEDPSYPAFRLQFQGLNENNHRAYWTLDVRVDAPPPPPPPPMCVMRGDECAPGVTTCCDPSDICGSVDSELYACMVLIID